MDHTDSRPGDLLLRDAPLYRDGRWDGDCLVVRDGLIAGLGSHDEVAHLVGPDTRVESLAGRWLLPAFHDAHVHPVQAGTEMNLCNLTDLGTIEEYVDRIASYVAAHPDRPWVTGGGWSMDAFPGGVPTADLLDRACPDRPAFLPNRDHHSARVNTRALELAGIDAHTPDPADGRIGASAATRSIAPSCSAPVGTPSGPRSIRPSAGSGVCASMPASARARVLTHAEWWSRFGQEDRPVRGHGVQQVGGGEAAGEGVHRPAAAGDPRAVRVLAHVRRDPLDVLLTGAEVGEVAEVHLGARLHRVDVGVVEGRQQPAPGQALHPGVGSDEVGDVVVGAHAGDAPVPYGEAVAVPASVAEGGGVAQEQVGGAGLGVVHGGRPIVVSGRVGQRPATTSAARARGEVVDRPAASRRSAAW